MVNIRTGKPALAEGYAPRTINHCLTAGYGYYQVRDPEVRQLIIDYIVRRQGDTDYVTREGLARSIAGQFWSEIEKIAPEQRDLTIPHEVYEQWRETVRVRKDGKPRVDGGTSLLLPVRAFYMDLQSWVLEEPERWARWAAPCPIPPADLRGFGKRRRRINERMADRVRERQPLLPTLVTHVEDRYTTVKELLDAARATPLGKVFTHAGRSYQRMNSRPDQRHHDDPQFPEPLRTRRGGRRRRRPHVRPRVRGGLVVR